MVALALVVGDGCNPTFCLFQSPGHDSLGVLHMCSISFTSNSLVSICMVEYHSVIPSDSTVMVSCIPARVDFAVLPLLQCPCVPSVLFLVCQAIWYTNIDCW